MTASFQIISISSFTSHSTIRHHLFSLPKASSKFLQNHGYCVANWDYLSRGLTRLKISLHFAMATDWDLLHNWENTNILVGNLEGEEKRRLF
jgi:hypothetical protein